MMRGALLALLVVTAAPAAAQEPTPLRWTEHTNVPARISDGLVVTQVALATLDAWQADRRGHAFGCLAARNAVSLAVTTALKYAVHRRRPDGSDDHSFPSGHTAMATVNGTPGWRYGLAVGVGWGRQAAGRHYATDVLAGAGIGWLSQKVCTP